LIRPGEIRDRLDTDHGSPMVVLSSELYNEVMNRAIAAPLLATDQIAPCVPTKGGFIGFSLLQSLPLSAFSEPRGTVPRADLDEARGYITGALTT
jgi:mRNA-degrading endonuclease toxin of MazEF toxin-antitoxin module